MVAPVTIKEHMEVLGSDGVHVGTVDHLEGRDQVKLTKHDPDAGGEHHFIRLRGSITWTRTSTSNSPVPRRRRAGRPTDGISEQTQSPRGRLGARGEFFAGRSAAAVARVFSATSR